MITLIEIFRLIVMTIAIGYIFSGFIRTPTLQRKNNFEDLKFSILIAAPAVVLHEMAHKFVALALGINAEFFASYFGLGIGVVLRLVGSPFLVFVPGFVKISGATLQQSGIIALAGPLTNLVLFSVAHFLLTKNKNYSRKTLMGLFLTKRINMILFFFNMIPFGPFDGAKVLAWLLSLV